MRNFAQALLAVLVCCLLSPQGASAAGDCRVAGGLPAIVDIMKGTLWRKQSLDAQSARRLHSLATGVNLRRVSDDMHHLGVEFGTYELEQLIERAHQLALNGTPKQKGPMRATVRRVENLIGEACEREAEAEAKNSQSAQAKEAEHSDKAERVARAVDESRASGAGRWRILAPFAILVATIIVMMAVYYVYWWAYARAHDRYYCLIPAKLLIGNEHCFGHISILGEKGCRIMLPKTSQEMSDKIYASHKELYLCVGEARLQLKLIGTKNGIVSCFFTEALEVEMLEGLLSKSLQARRYAPKSIPKYRRSVT